MQGESGAGARPARCSTGVGALAGDAIALRERRRSARRSADEDDHLPWDSVG
ncbi:hypothetical protein STRNTR1_1627 [Stenotrophomonas maltophilia]|nr:hypothetical protein STRNTR1_1627 [Stenotrophomonas maltophilia]